MKRAGKFLLYIVFAVLAPAIVSKAIENRYKQLHGVHKQIDREVFTESSFERAFETLNTLGENQRFQISSYLWNPEDREVLFLVRGTPRWQVLLNDSRLFIKQLVIPGGKSAELPRGFSKISMRYQEGDPTKPPELRWSKDFVNSYEIEQRESYLDPVSSSQVRMEKLGIAAGILSRLNLILLPVYFLLRRPVSHLRSTLQNDRYAWWFLALFLIMAVLRFAGFRYQMEEALHPDERLVDHMIVEVRSAGLQLKHFWYTTGYIYICAALETLTSWIVGKEALEHFAQRFVSVVASIATCIFILLIGSRLISRAVGVVASVLFGFSFMPVYLAHLGIIEPFLVFLFFAALFLIVRLEQTQNRRSLVFAGIVSGFAVATKQTGLFIAIPFLVLFFVLVHRKVLKKFGIVELLCFTGSAFVGYFLLAPFTILKFSEFYGYQLKQLTKLQGETSVRFFLSGSDMGKSGFTMLLENLEDGLGYPLIITAFGGMLWMCWKSRLAALLLVPLTLVYVIVSGKTAVIPYHYALLLCPLFVIFAAYAITMLASLRAKYFTSIATALTVLILLIPLGRIFVMERIMQGIDTRRQAEHWCYKNLPAGSRIDYELFGPRFPIPMFDATTVPVFKRPKWKRYYLSRAPQYYIEDNLSSELFASPDPNAFPVEREWLQAVHQTGIILKEFSGEQRWLFNPHLKIYRIPQILAANRAD